MNRGGYEAHMDTREQATVSRLTTKILGWLVLVAAVLQAAAPAVIFSGPGESPGSGAGPDLFITPVDWAFSIWAVIYVLAIIQAIAVLTTRSARVSPLQRVAQLVLYGGATAWIAMARLDSSVATAAVLVVMFAAAVVFVVETARRPPRPRWLAVVTRAAGGLYAGWVTAVVFLNISTALVDASLLAANQVTWQLIVLVLAVVALISVLGASRGNLMYAIGGLWALIGITVTGNADGTMEVVIVAAASMILVLLITAGVKWATRTQEPFL